jgi:pyruvate dehydrogenase E2 component (dihydrolipoamide acetyltransferase)
MAQVTLHIPQIGEGLQEARLVAHLKAPGDSVRRDEPLYQMETDKAVMDVESPYEGVLTSWLAEVDEILPIGGPVAAMEVAGEVSSAPSVHGSTPIAAVASVPAAAGPGGGLAGIPPRTRAYAKEKGVSEAQLAELAAKGGKLMPADIDAYLGGDQLGAAAPASVGPYKEAPLPSKQRLLASRLVRGSALVVPGTMTVVCRWGAIEAERERVKASGSDFQPSAFTMFSYAVAQTMKEFPAFRSSLIGDATLRTYDHVALGIAVGLPGDELVLAAVPDADTLGWTEFARVARERIDLARSGQDQANEAVTLSLTNMQSFGLRDAVPVVAPPAVATLFLGEAYTALDPSASPETAKPVRLANLALSFDHRLMNGVGAAQFLNAVKAKVEAIGSVLQ